MSSFRVSVPFVAFEREYKPGEILTDVELSLWQPNEARDAKIGVLLATGRIEPLPVGEVAGVYPPTIGNGAADIKPV